MTATKITRKELYELVWRTPMSRLAVEFGVSDVALAKTCDRLSVPRPGRGYWAQVAARIRVKRPPLGKVSPGAREWTTVERSDSSAPRQPKREAPNVPVPADLRDAPDVIKRLGLVLGAAQKDEHERLVVPGSRDPVLAVTIATHRRALLLLAGLAAALTARGHSLAFRADGAVNGLSIVLGDDVVGITIIERLEQKDHVLTPEEERQAATGYRYGIQKHDYFAGGRLQLVVQDARGTRTSCSDTKTRKLDQQLGAVIVAAESEALRRRDQRRAEEERRKEDERRRAAEEEERRRQRAREARAQHLQRLATDLREMARAWSEAEEIRGFLRAVRDKIPVGMRDERTAVWLQWADACVLSLDPLSNLEELAKGVEPDDEQPSQTR